MTRRRPLSSAGRTDTLLPVQVRYYKRMYLGRTYPVQVCWKSAERGVAVKPVTLRLEVAGAIVVPAEHVLRPADPEDKVTFYVTPLSGGKIHHHVIEVHFQDAKVFEMPLKARVSTQRFTYVLLAMAFLVPWLLNNYCKSPYKQDNLGPKLSLIALINDNLPDMTVFDQLPAGATIKEWVETATEFLGNFYFDLHNWCNEYPIATYATLSFLTLALLSSWWHSPKRRRRTSDPIELTPQSPG